MQHGGGAGISFARRGPLAEPRARGSSALLRLGSKQSELEAVGHDAHAPLPGAGGALAPPHAPPPGAPAPQPLLAALPPLGAQTAQAPATEAGSRKLQSKLVLKRAGVWKR